uniref:Serpin-Z1 n=1 Tax=Aegilops tauschii TaxID=37682 RepID=M8CHX2_AEGTA
MEDLAGAIRDLAALSTRLLLQLSGDGEKRNLAISPLSIHSVVVLLAAGATGDTLDQIVSFLGLSGGAAHAALASEVATLVFGRDAGVEPHIRCAVGVWVESSLRLRPAYADKVASEFKAAVRAMPFRENVEEARVEINRWFEDKTEGFIKDLMPEGHLDATLTALVIGNLLYMRGTWLDPFDPEYTLDGDFFLADADGSRVRVPFMKSTNDQCISCHPGFKVLQLHYESKVGAGGHHPVSMPIYLPDERDGLQALLREISSSGTAEFVARCVPAARGVEVGNLRIPKFKVSSKMDARDVLQGLGLELPFRFTHDWSEMIELAEPEPPLRVQNVLHECVVEVDEDGTMAAAATEADCDVGFSLYGEEPARVDFVADHPFLFLLRDADFYSSVPLVATSMSLFPARLITSVKCIQEQNIEDKVFGITLDNATSDDSVAAGLKRNLWPRMLFRCYEKHERIH